MKNTLLLSLLIFTIATVTSQEYKPFPTSNAAWKESHFYVYGSSHHEDVCINHEITGDTTINEKTYSKVYKTRWSDYYWGGTQTTNYNNVYVGAIREDSLKQIFLRKPYQNADQLLYDFNLNVGDTLPELYGLDPNVFYIVDSIDSVLVMDQYHKSTL